MNHEVMLVLKYFSSSRFGPLFTFGQSERSRYGLCRVGFQLFCSRISTTILCCCELSSIGSSSR